MTLDLSSTDKVKSKDLAACVWCCSCFWVDGKLDYSVQKECEVCDHCPRMGEHVSNFESTMSL